MAETVLNPDHLVGSVLTWFDEMLADEAKAVRDYNAFADFLEGAGERQHAVDDRTISENDRGVMVPEHAYLIQLLRDSAVHVRAIAVDEHKHHDVFMKMKDAFESVSFLDWTEK